MDRRRRVTSRQFATLGPLIPFLGVLTSCASLSGEARNTFGRAAGCPTDRVERLAFWRQQREAQRREIFGDCEWFEAHPGDTVE
jgi:hypothetical protein